MTRKAVLFLATIAISLSISWSEASKHSKATTYSIHPPCIPPSSSLPRSPWGEWYNTLNKPTIKVKQSAFARALFSIPISPSCARLSSYELPPPLGIEFFKVFQDDNIPILVKWTNVEVKVDPNFKGMTLSYERKVDHMPEKVILTVPTKEAFETWVRKAREYYNAYEEAFWEEKEIGRIELEEKERKQKELLDKLRQGPILVYPEQKQKF